MSKKKKKHVTRPVRKMIHFGRVYRLDKRPGDRSRVSAVYRKAVEDDAVRLIFERFRDEWKEDVKFLSAMDQIVLHPAYQRIIGIGKKVLPCIFEEIKRENDHWYWALNAITGEDPVPAESVGDIEACKDAWIQWQTSKA